jgi:chromosome partitioning protein
LGKILAVTNQKGGVGKTTTCVNLAASLVATKKKVLLIDLDPQGNATMGSGIDKNDVESSLYNVLVEGKPVAEVSLHGENAGYDIVPSNADVTAAEVELLDLDNNEYRLRDALVLEKVAYDYIIIDCPPSLNMLTVNALAAADGVIIPMQCEYYALEGLAALMDTINQIQESVNPNLKIEGLLRTMYDPRNSLTKDVSEQLTEYFGDKVYRTSIPRNIRLAEAPSFGMPVLFYDKQSKGAVAYLALAGEMLRRSDKEKAAETVEP